MIHSLPEKWQERPEVAEFTRTLENDGKKKRRMFVWKLDRIPQGYMLVNNPFQIATDE